MERSLRLGPRPAGRSETERLDEGPVGQFDPAAQAARRRPRSARRRRWSTRGSTCCWSRARCCSRPALRGGTSTRPAGRDAVHGAGSPRTARPAARRETRSHAARSGSPVWDRPCTLAEIRQLFGEARASWRGRPAQRAVDFYAATRTLGVARGISEFIRYGIQQRNGLAFVAVPVARVEVRSKPEVRLAARVEDWVSWIRNADRSSATGMAVRRFDAAHLRYARTAARRRWPRCWRS